MPLPNDASTDVAPTLPPFVAAPLNAWSIWADAVATRPARSELPDEPHPTEREALAEAFVTVLHDLAEHHHRARNAWTRLENVPFSQRDRANLEPTQKARAYARALDGALVTLVHQALHVGLFDTVLDALAREVPAQEVTVYPSGSPFNYARSGPAPDTIPLWDKLPGRSMGLAMVRAALGQAPFSAAKPASLKGAPGHPSSSPTSPTSPTSSTPLDRLTQERTASAFWYRWASHLRAFPQQDDHLWLNDLADAMAWQVAALARRPSGIATSRTLFARIITSQGIGPSHPQASWRTVGARMGDTLKRAYPRLSGLAPDDAQALFDTLPPHAWLGMRTRVKPTSAMGRWITAHLWPLARADQDGPVAETLCLDTWATLDRTALLEMEAAVPGITRRHLGRLVQSDQVMDLVDPSASPHTAWAREVLGVAGAPVAGQAPLYNWAVLNPDKAVATFFTLFAQLEGQMLRTALASDRLGPSPIEPASAPRPSRRL